MNGRTGTATVHERAKRAAANFDRLARVYRWMEYLSFGRTLERCRFQFLSDCGNARRALVLGDGDGRFTARLLAINPIVQVDVIDSSPAMLAQLQRRARAVPDTRARLRTICTDVRDFTPERDGYDLVVSHFFLDCFADDEVCRIVEQILPYLTPNATWLVSEFSIPATGWARFGARLVVRSLYFAFLLLTDLKVKKLPDYARALNGCGFRMCKQSTRLGGLLVSDLWQRR